MNHASSHVTASSDSVIERCDCEPGLHPRIYGVADDPVGEDVLERTDVELAFIGPVFGDVTDPQFVRRVGLELVPDPALLVRHRAEVVVDRRAGLLTVLAALLPERAPPAVVRADPPGSPLGHDLAGVAGLVEEEPVTELGVITMGVEQRVGPVGLFELGVGDRVGEPTIVGLASDLEHPALHRDGDSVSGEVTDERVAHFPGRCA